MALHSQSGLRVLNLIPFTCDQLEKIMSIVTPSRWKQYDEEMACAFEAICQAAIKEEKDTQIVRLAVFRFRVSNCVLVRSISWSS